MNGHLAQAMQCDGASQRIGRHRENLIKWLGRMKALPGWKHPYELMPGYPLKQA